MAGKLTVFFDRTVGRNSYRLHRFLYQHTGGVIGHRSPQGPMLLLTTTGRKSGLPRTTPLLYLADGSRFVVVASNGGREQPPAWLLNLETKPDAQIQVGRRVMTATAHVLDADAKAKIWPRLLEQHRGRSRYETLTDRELKVVALEPATEAA